MASMLVLLLQLLLVSLVSASHYFGGSVRFTQKGRNPDGTLRMEIRYRDTFVGCQNIHQWICSSGSCSRNTKNLTRTIDSSTNTQSSTTQWCETETLSTGNVLSDKPFQMRASSCCWIQTRNSVSSWNLLTAVDLGTRSDTGKPNSSPAVSILPFLRVPQNCPRTYNIMSFDTDGDHVRCRYGNHRNVECSTCNHPLGFTIDQDSCKLHYKQSTAHTNSYAFEMVVEDFPVKGITLTYSDGSQSFKYPPPAVRSKRMAVNPYNVTTMTSKTSVFTSATTAASHGTTGVTHSPGTPGRQQSTDPLSKLPLQFSFLVDPSVPSCQEGNYLPKFVQPTPPNGERIQAEVNKEVEIRVKAQALKTTIDNIIMTGPLNISKLKTASDEFVIRWTPVPDDQGEHYPVCFVVESKNGANVYQSEMRCVRVEVVEEQVKTTVICNETTMTVTVEKATFPGVHEDHLQLNDPTNTACRLTSNSSHIFAVIPLNACGTQIEEDADNLLFKNEITTVDNTGDLITRKHLLEVQFYCQYRKRENVTLGFTVHRDNVTVMEKGFGTFTYEFEFYPTNEFEAVIDPSSYPLEYEIGSRIFMQIEATSSVIDTELFVESCSAAPYDIPNYTPTYPIIQNGCNVDSTVVTHPRNNSRQFRFSLEAFKFIGLHDQVYVSCSVMMCKAGEPGTRCSQGCTNSTNWQSRGSFSHRGKREAVSQTSMHFISQGPLRLRRSAELTGDPAMNPDLNLNLVLIAGCVLAAVAMISAVVIYKAKISKGGYQPLATAES